MRRTRCRAVRCRYDCVLTPDIPAFELLCLETPQFLSNLKHIYIELPTDYVFDRLFHIKPQIKTINGVPIFNHIVSEATLKSHDSVIRTQMIQLVIDKFYEVCRPIAVDYEGTAIQNLAVMFFAPDRDYFVCALFPSPLVNVKLAYRTSEDFLNASLNSSALVTLSQSSNIAFIWGKQQPSEIPPGIALRSCRQKMWMYVITTWYLRLNLAFHFAERYRVQAKF